MLTTMSYSSTLSLDGGNITSKFPGKQSSTWTSHGFLLSLIVFLAVLRHFKVKKQRKIVDESGYLGVDSIPGPMSLPFPFDFLGNLMGFVFCKFKDAGHKTQKTCEYYGDCVRFTLAYRNLIGLNSPELIQTLLKSSRPGHLSKTPFSYQNVMEPYIMNSILVSGGDFWHSQRKILIKSVTYQSLRLHMDMLNKHAARLVATLGVTFEDGLCHQVNDSISGTMMDIICELVTGRDIHGTDEGVLVHHNLQIWKKGAGTRTRNPWLQWKPLWKLHPLYKGHEKAVKELNDFALRRVTEHRLKTAVGEETSYDGDAKNQNKFRSVLDLLVEAGISDEQIVDELNSMFFAGHETSATTIHFFCFMMALNLEHQEECRKEVDALFDHPTKVRNGEITFDSLSDLKVLKRCIYETLRLFPPVFIFLRKLGEPLILEWNGKKVQLPEGTNVFVSPWNLHRNKKYFPEPKKFDPDRFLPEEVSKRHSYAFIPFAAGPRNCLGYKFGMMEMKVIAAYMLRNFEITTTDRMDTVAVLPKFTTTPARDYWFHFKKRSNIS